MRRTRAAAKAGLVSGEDTENIQLQNTKPATKRRRKSTPNAKSNSGGGDADLTEGSAAIITSDQNEATQMLVLMDVEVLRADGKDLPIDSSPESDEIVVLSDVEDRPQSFLAKGAASSGQAFCPRRGDKGQVGTTKRPVSKKSAASSSVQQLPMLDVVDISSGTSSGASSPVIPEEVPSSASSNVTNSTSSPTPSSSRSRSESSSPRKISTAKSGASTSTSKTIITSTSPTKTTGHERFSGIIVGAQRKLKKNKKLSVEDILRMNMTDSIGAATLANSIKPSRKVKTGAAEPYNFKKALDKLVPDELIRKTAANSASHSEIDLDRTLTARQAEIADLDTDPDVEVIEEEDASVRAKKFKTKSQLDYLKHRQTATASRHQDHLKELNNDYANFQESMQNETANHQIAAQNECVVLGDDEFSPLPSPATPVRPRPSQRAAQEKWQQGITQMTIRITYKSTSYTFNVTKEWDVAKLRKLLADRIGKEVDRVHIYSKSDEGMRDGRSLGSYDVDHCDVLEASVHEVAKIPIAEQPPEDVVKLKFQKQGLKKPIIINVMKTTSFQQIQLMVAQELKIDISTIRFEFDGESVALTATPESLEMDDDDCIDIYET